VIVPALNPTPIVMPASNFIPKDNDISFYIFMLTYSQLVGFLIHSEIIFTVSSS
jgi:hypothetical protein